MEISNFDDLLRAARAQPEPQRLLFVFAEAALPEDSTPEQRASFAAGHGGELVPLMSVDKAPEELAGFDALVQESLQFAPDWAVVFVAGLGGRDGRAPKDAETERALERMIEAVRGGEFGAFLPFDRQGVPVLFD
jgi:hypothetical protein